MLTQLSVRDVVLIDRLALAFGPGLSALTGETGAGKSILLDALGLALGARGDARLVRPGAGQAIVVAAFALPAGHPARGLAAEHGLDGGDGSEDLVLRRTLGADGRSRAFVDDQPVGVGLLRAIGDALVEVHGQFESQRLLDAATHRDLLDAFGGLEGPARGTADARAAWRAARDARRAAEADVAAARRDEDFVRQSLAELDAIEPVAGEEAALAERRALKMNAEKLVQAMDDARRGLAGDGRAPGVETALRAVLRDLGRVAETADGRLDAAIEALARAADEAAEGEALLGRAVDDLDLDPRRLEEAEERLFALRALARKHGAAVDDLAELRRDLAARLAAIDDGGAALQRLEAEEAQARAAYADAAERLSAARGEAASRLDSAVAAELEPLRLGAARFATHIERDADEDGWGDAGWDRVQFRIATNPGSEPGPLGRIASGGELARFMLALKVVLARADPVPTLVFDEVDAGVGGAVAAAVGERLDRLAADVQVLVLTHSPQVAARGTHHWRVVKSAGERDARTTVEVLDGAGRKEEIARMLAGARVTDEARAAADSLLQGGVA